MRRRLLALLIVLPLAACVSIPKIPKSAKKTRLEDACAVTALVMVDLLRDHREDTAAVTRSSVLIGTPQAYRIAGGAEFSLDLRKCPAVTTLALGGGMTLWAPGMRPNGPLRVFSSPIFSRDGNEVRMTWSDFNGKPYGIAYHAVRTPLGWRLKDEDTEEWVVSASATLRPPA